MASQKHPWENQKLVQSNLTSAFFKKPTQSASRQSSPYFAKPPPTPTGNPGDTLEDFITFTDTDVPTNLIDSNAPPSKQPPRDNWAFTTDVADEEETQPNSPPWSPKSIHLHPSARPQEAVAAPKNPRKSELLQAVAQETRDVLPRLLKTLPHAAPDSKLYDRSTMVRLDPAFCPGYRLPVQMGNRNGCIIRVVDGDTFDVAIAMQNSPSTLDQKPVAVLNMASEIKAGGGWLRGSLAQEEAMCYRSSLYFTLKNKYYPIPDLGGIYSPKVVVFRDALHKGHGFTKAPMHELPILSVISVAAVRKPDTTYTQPLKYRHSRDRERMKSKMRLTLRIAAMNKHRRLVLGALGCGAFSNPQQEVVECWKEVFAEREFSGGWWESVVFAVLDNFQGDTTSDSNFGIFYRGLQGLIV